MKAIKINGNLGLLIEKNTDKSIKTDNKEKINKYAKNNITHSPQFLFH